MSYDLTYKIITGGDASVGKTTMLKRYVEGQFVDTQMTIGVDIMQKILTLEDGLNVSLQLWDFGGQQHFRFFLDSFVKGANGAFLMFDLTNMNSFNNLEEWVKIIRKDNSMLPIVLIGSKLDLKELIVIDDEMVEDAKERFNFADYLKISSKTGYNVNKSFIFLVDEIRKYVASLRKTDISIINNS
jgi:small GTP-binding protein